ncbi:hypothetical protein MTP99_008896 [Tenebrio molitor]|nr:hypothetical protein MTP99_008896 [Tenebrio molitor]
MHIVRRRFASHNGRLFDSVEHIESRADSYASTTARQLPHRKIYISMAWPCARSFTSTLPTFFKSEVGFHQRRPNCGAAELAVALRGAVERESSGESKLDGGAN